MSAAAQLTAPLADAPAGQPLRSRKVKDGPERRAQRRRARAQSQLPIGREPVAEITRAEFERRYFDAWPNGRRNGLEALWTLYRGDVRRIRAAGAAAAITTREQQAAGLSRVGIERCERQIYRMSRRLQALGLIEQVHIVRERAKSGERDCVEIKLSPLNVRPRRTESFKEKRPFKGASLLENVALRASARAKRERIRLDSRAPTQHNDKPSAAMMRSGSAASIESERARIASGLPNGLTAQPPAPISPITRAARERRAPARAERELDPASAKRQSTESEPDALAEMLAAIPPAGPRDAGPEQRCAAERMSPAAAARLTTAARELLASRPREDSGEDTLAAAPWLAQLPPRLLIAAAFRAQYPKADPRLTLRSARRLDDAGERLARDLGRAGAAARMLEILAGDWEELTDPAHREGGQASAKPCSLGRVALAIHYDARRWRLALRLRAGKLRAGERSQAAARPPAKRPASNAPRPNKRWTLYGAAPALAPVCPLGSCDGSGLVLDAASRTETPCKCRAGLVKRSSAKRNAGRMTPAPEPAASIAPEPSGDGAKLKAARIAADLTLAQLAERIGAGRTRRYSVARQLAELEQLDRWPRPLTKAAADAATWASVKPG